MKRKAESDKKLLISEANKKELKYKRLKLKWDRLHTKNNKLISSPTEKINLISVLEKYRKYFLMCKEIK